MAFVTEVKLKDAILKAKRRITITQTANVPHALVIHEGRRPGARGPSAKMLERWCRDKLGKEGLAFPVARSIHKKGFEGVPYLSEPLKKNKKKWGAYFEKNGLTLGLKKAALQVADAWQEDATFMLGTGNGGRRFFKGTLVKSIQPKVEID